MPSLFTAEGVSRVGAQKAATSTLTVSNGPALGIVTQLQLQFNRPIQKIFSMTGDAGVSTCFYVGGRADGQGSIGRLATPAVTAAYGTFGDLCESDKSLEFQLPKDCATDNQLTYSCTDVTMTGVTISGESTNMVFQENVTLMFADLEHEGGTTGGFLSDLINAVGDIFT